MVVITISTLLSAVAVVSSSRFNSTVLLTNLAYEIAFSIREAQSFGLNVREFAAGTEAATFNAGYGAHFFGRHENGNPNWNDYIIFADFIAAGDKTGNFFYDGNEDGGGEFVAKYTTKKGNFIDKFCGVKANGEEVCGGATDDTLDFLNIVFLRPNPDAIFASNLDLAFRAAKIYVRSPQNTVRVVRVENTGQITVCLEAGC